MFVQKQINVCLLAVLALQVFFASASPVAPPTEADEDDLAQEVTDGPAKLQTRGLWDFGSSSVPAASALGTGLKSVDSGLRSVHQQGGRAVRAAAGAGTELVTGVNPNTYYEMGQEAMKKAIRGARYGTEVAYDATDKTLDTLQSLHDKKKQLLDDYVKPVAPVMVNNAIDSVNTGFDSTLATIKDRVQAGRSVAENTLDQLEEKIERGESIMPTAVTDGVDRVGKMLAPYSGWVSGWMPSTAAAPSVPNLSDEAFKDDVSKVTGDRIAEAMKAAKAMQEAKAAAEAKAKAKEEEEAKAAQEAKAAADATAAAEAKAAQAMAAQKAAAAAAARSPNPRRLRAGFRPRSLRSFSQ